MKREMSYQTVDLSGVCDRNSLHDRLQESLTLPSWYGRNLDALYDALTARLFQDVPVRSSGHKGRASRQQFPLFGGRFC